MYKVAVRRDFIANHYLIGGDWGAENQLHAHHYLLELELAGDTLDGHGYLVDIVEIEACLNRLVEDYRDSTLNERAEFAGLNPSIEHFCRIACQRLSSEIGAPNIHLVTARLWENQIAWASYELGR